MAQSGNIFQGAVNTGVTGPRIVVGIDYGTSNTGTFVPSSLSQEFQGRVTLAIYLRDPADLKDRGIHWPIEFAWAQTDGSAKDSLSDLGNDLIVFRDWPEGSVQRVPSAISYSPTPPEQHRAQWGWSIADDSKVLKWTKLELEPQNTMKELLQLKELTKGLDLVKELRENETVGMMNDVPQHLTMSAEDIVRDYLSRASRVWFQYMRSQGRYTLERVPLDLVITHPANWKYEAMNKTYRAVMGAFPDGMFPTLRNVSFASEPESWALYSVQDILMKGHDVLIPGECFVICDAGGGTVDLVSYRVNKVEPLELTRVGNITGGARCGGAFVDQAFLEFLQPRLLNLDIDPEDVGTGGHMIFKPRSRVLLARFERIKHAFNGTGDASITIPRGTRIAPGFEDSIVNGVLTLTEQDLRDMFSASVRGTLSLLSKQLTKVRNTRYNGVPCRVTNIIMAGGFSENEYLFNEVTTFANRGADIAVQRADDCWIGIVKGAVLRGMGVGMAAAPTVQSCPRHYGLCVSYRYEEWNNLEEITVIDPFNGQRMVPGKLFWLVRQGDAILPFEPINTTFNVLCRLTKQQYELGNGIRIAFVASAILDPPSTMTRFSRAKNEVIYLDVDPQKIPQESLQKKKKASGGSYLTADLQVVFNITREVEVKVMHRDHILTKIVTNL